MICFISRDEKDWVDVIEACNSMPLYWHCQSLIEIIPCSFVVPERSFDWVFFSSKEGVNAFFSQQLPSPQYRYGAIGPATGRLLAAYVTPHFIGQSKNTIQVGHSFADLIGSELVLFPISDISVRTVQQQLPSTQVIDLVVYSTQLSAARIPTCDLYIFTSPSNVDAFFQSNQLPPAARTAVFGVRTAHQLARHSAHSPVILDQTDAISMATAIKQNFLR